MVRNDLKDLILKEYDSLDSIFMEHRDIEDPGNYRVGEIKVGNQFYTLVYNPDTGEIMDYYYDDISGPIIDAFPGLLKISRRKTRKNLAGIIHRGTWFIDRRDYSFVSISKDNQIYRSRGGNKEKGYPNFWISRATVIPSHILISSLFIPNIDPKNKKVVNHKRKNNERSTIKDYRPENLEWCTIKENNTRDKRKGKVQDVWYLVDGEEWYDEREMMKTLGLTQKSLRVKIHSGFKFPGIHSIQGYTKLAKEYVEKYKDLDKFWWDSFYDTWREVPGRLNAEVNMCGLFRKSGFISVGGRRDAAGDRTFYGNSPSSRVIVGLFYDYLGYDDNPLDNPENTVDHNNNDSFDNRLINLKILTRAENIAKENKRQKKRLA